ncbi:1-phosphofructokinase family hexose kinase [Cesiribacter andamanensis]|uniref:6-phosphofructokinase isozyme 2 n=1 Tax=Cesiribacter andamanensis AMV16 TaxID=1279009 RepID=M7N4W7_9BACT|nr:1-phosphofructokinase family hexose kinase [Cesiribacter andamanensis]EMR02256.1 6-phosphofructokinase isozyme 2 [Cesiribacter andamanensis AMV16]
MAKIVTFTLNPALDKSSALERLMPEEKLRCDPPTWEPGGGGINVSRALKNLGGDSLCIYIGGGHTGQKMEELLRQEGIQQHRIEGKRPTRENFVVYEKSSGKQYRFGMPGEAVSQQELDACLEVIRQLPQEVKYLVASGSLPPGAPDDFYGQIAQMARERNIRCVIDTSGPALQKVTEVGGCLLKPNLSELSQLAGKDHINALEQEEIARELISQGKASMLAVSLGPRGAMLATKEHIEYVVPPTVKQNSTVGAGDSMVAGMVLALSLGKSQRDMIRWGVAAGTAATMTPGSELCRRQDVDDIYNWIREKAEQQELPPSV